MTAFPLIREQFSPNIDDRPQGMPIDTLVLHYTGMRSARDAIERLSDPAPPTGIRVSSHYVVEEDGTIWRMVPETRRGFHAGISFWRGRERLNDCSIGIEIVNPGHEFGYRPFPMVQIEAVTRLCQDIFTRHPCPPRNVVAHSDIAPNRKQDPGELFPWRQLAQHGIGLWPEDIPPDQATDTTALAHPLALYDGLMDLGYGFGFDEDLTAAMPVVVRAFQRHWRPEAVTGIADQGTQARLDGVLRLIRAA